MDDTPPQDAQPDAPRSGFTLDLSTGAAGKAKRPKGFAPVVQQTINLTTKKVAPESEAAPPEVPRAEQKRDEPGRDGSRRHESGRPAPRQTRDERRPSGGTSLADLLDEATLARLRGR